MLCCTIVSELLAKWAEGERLMKDGIAATVGAASGPSSPKPSGPSGWGLNADDGGGTVGVLMAAGGGSAAGFSPKVPLVALSSKQWR